MDAAKLNSIENSPIYDWLKLRFKIVAKEFLIIGF